MSKTNWSTLETTPTLTTNSPSLTPQRGDFGIQTDLLIIRYPHFIDT